MAATFSRLPTCDEWAVRGQLPRIGFVRMTAIPRCSGIPYKRGLLWVQVTTATMVATLATATVPDAHEAPIMPKMKGEGDVFSHLLPL